MPTGHTIMPMIHTITLAAGTAAHRLPAILAAASLAASGLLFAPGSALAEPARPPEGDVVVAVLGLENSGGDPRQDYLAAVAEGILSYDLSVLADIPLVERRSLGLLLSEKELSLSGLAEPGAAERAGGLLGASHLLYGEYAVVGGELALTVRLAEAASGAVVAFRDRGASEHVAHRIAERVAARLLGRKDLSFADAANDRSILSLRDETPGVIALHSPIRAAEIYLDDEFFGFTKGDEIEPILIGGVRPGRRVVRVHLSGGDFGVVVLPRVEFRDWEAVIDVRPGGRHAVRDRTRHFNEALFRLEYLDRVSRKAERSKAASLAVEKSLSFADRSGTDVPVSYSVTPVTNGEGARLELSLTVGAGAGATVVRGAAAWPATKDAPATARIVAGLVALEVEIGESYGSLELELALRRTDVYQGLHREGR